MQQTGPHPDLGKSMNRAEYLQQHISSETQYFTFGRPLMLESGVELRDVTVAFRTWGDIKNAEHRAILICHALTGSADADRWWPGIIGAGCAFDPADDFIICSNILAGCYGTTGPASKHPQRQGFYQADFPQITVRDMVTVQAALLDQLGVDRLQLIIGPSLGGMQALEWALMYPERVRAIVPVGTCGRHSAWCIGMSEVQRAAIKADPNWHGGFYADDQTPEQGLAVARMMAVCSYRSWENMEQRFARERRPNGEFQVQSYLRYQGQKLNNRFDANAYVRLTQAMNSHDVARGRGEYHEVLRSLRQPALVISVSSDILYPPAEQKVLAEHLPNAQYRILDSEHGHDGFLIKTHELGGMVSAFREQLDHWSEGRNNRASDLATAAIAAV